MHSVESVPTKIAGEFMETVMHFERKCETKELRISIFFLFLPPSLAGGPADFLVVSRFRESQSEIAGTEFDVTTSSSSS